MILENRNNNINSKMTDKLPSGIEYILDTDIKFQVTDYKICKVNFMKFMEMTDLQFDILWYIYLQAGGGGVCITDGKELYLDKGKYKMTFKKANATVLLKTINRIKKHKNPIEILMENQKAFNKYIYDKTK